MQFQIGPWQYRVIISNGHLLDDQCSPVAGLCSWIDHTITISGTIPRERRLSVLLHELKHAWIFAFGEPASEEDDANSSASFTAMFHQSFPDQGGDAALLAMEPDADEPAPAHVAAGPSTLTWAQASPDGGTECGCCGRRFSAGEIVTEPAKFEPLIGKTLISRGVYCDGCGIVQHWTEGVLLNMSPNGQIIGRLGQLRGLEATEWLRQHGEQVGVMLA